MFFIVLVKCRLTNARNIWQKIVVGILQKSNQNIADVFFNFSLH